MSSRQPLLQLTWRGATARDEDAVRAAAGMFRQCHCARLPSLLDPALLTSLQDQIDRGAFFTKRHGTAATELCLEPDAAVALLHFLVNDPALYRLVEDVTGCGTVRCFFGRVYRHVPGTDHHHAWHSDVTHNRVIGMSINLGRDAYEGGIFEIRERDEPSTVAAIANIVPGDTILFRLSEALEHRVTTLHGTASKTAFAGWFRREPDYWQACRVPARDGQDSA